MRILTLLLRKPSLYLAVAGLLLATSLVKKMGAEAPKLEPIAMPAENPYEHAIAASGIIEATDRNIAIGAPQAGLVLEVYVHVGDHVHTGDPLFKLDDRDLQAELEVLNANLEIAEATAKRLEDQWQRLKSVKDPRAVSLDEIKTREHDVAVALAQVRMAICQVNKTKMLISRLVVKAPSDGMILQNNIRMGEYVSPNDALPPLLLGDIQHLQVRADIDEQNACHFCAKQQAVAFPKNNTTVKIPLKFVRLEPYVLPKRSLTGASDERVDTRVLQVIYTMEKPADFNLYVGQQVDVFIQDGIKQL